MNNKLYSISLERRRGNRLQHRVLLTPCGAATTSDLEQIVCTHPHDAAPIRVSNGFSVLAHEIASLESRLAAAGFAKRAGQ